MPHRPQSADEVKATSSEVGEDDAKLRLQYSVWTCAAIPLEDRDTKSNDSGSLRQAAAQALSEAIPSVRLSRHALSGKVQGCELMLTDNSQRQTGQAALNK